MNKFISLLAIAILTVSIKAQASLTQAPPDFIYKNKKAVFIDFQQASYNLTYDLTNKAVFVESTIVFTSKTEGYPLFDLIPEPLESNVDGVVVKTEAISDPDKETTLRVINTSLRPGVHRLTLRHQISTNVVFTPDGLASGFWMSDLNDRKYLEQYLPSNLEYDQYNMQMKVIIVGAEGRPHTLKANGRVTKISENKFEIIYPGFYSASSVFYHLFPETNAAQNVQFYFKSIDGRSIPVDIYTTYDTYDFVVNTKMILAELEKDYGPFPHNQVIIYGNSLSGGMEYSGATTTSLKALGHELFHSYHARGLIPANGNSGWMDEAIARWRDNKYPLLDKLDFPSTQLAGHSRWARKTDRMAYTEGSAFLSWIAFRMNEKGMSFKSFLRDYFQRYKYSTVTTQLFQRELSQASGLNLNDDFDRYIYGKFSKGLNHVHEEENPFHPEYSKAELLDLTWL